MTANNVSMASQVASDDRPEWIAARAADRILRIEQPYILRVSFNFCRFYGTLLHAEI